MEEVPAHLLNGLSPPHVNEVAAWWAGLTTDNRAEVAALCDPRCEDSFFGAIPEDAADSVPRVIGGRFVPSDDMAGWSEWHKELFDYLICHPELVFFEPPVVRIFYIGCTHHEAVRAVLAAGKIPAAFQCPLGLEGCPMRRLLSVEPNEKLHQVAAAFKLFTVHCQSSDPGR
jgi:hypothetical protein